MTCKQLHLHLSRCWDTDLHTQSMLPFNFKLDACLHNNPLQQDGPGCKTVPCLALQQWHSIFLARRHYCTSINPALLHHNSYTLPDGDTANSREAGTHKSMNCVWKSIWQNVNYRIWRFFFTPPLCMMERGGGTERPSTTDSSQSRIVINKTQY